MTVLGRMGGCSVRPVPAADALYDQALQRAVLGGASDLHVRYRGGSVHVPVERWCAPAGAADEAALDRLCAALPGHAQVLDLGCGPGRHTVALARRGVRALGVDTSAAAVELARRRGAPALRADALGPLPGAAGWDAVLLMDGNVGIGGDPLLLLCRVRDLLRVYGRVLVELDPGGATDSGSAYLTSGAAAGERFPWARLGTGALAATAGCADLAVRDTWTAAGRSFALLGVLSSAAGT